MVSTTRWHYNPLTKREGILYSHAARNTERLQVSAFRLAACLTVDLAFGLFVDEGITQRKNFFQTACLLLSVLEMLSTGCALVLFVSNTSLKQRKSVMQ